MICIFKGAVALPKYNTRQRQVLLNYLGVHPDELMSVQEISEALEPKRVSLSSVYRNLTELEAEGKVLRVSKGGARQTYYQYIAAEECRGCLHLNCRVCGKTFHMHAEGAEQLVAAIAQNEGFVLDKRNTVLYGVCRGCQESGEGTAATHSANCAAEQEAGSEELWP